jgi:hypothetical protein
VKDAPQAQGDAMTEWGRDQQWFETQQGACDRCGKGPVRWAVVRSEQCAAPLEIMGQDVTISTRTVYGWLCAECSREMDGAI